MLRGGFSKNTAFSKEQLDAMRDSFFIDVSSVERDPRHSFSLNVYGVSKDKKSADVFLFGSISEDAKNGGVEQYFSDVSSYKHYGRIHQLGSQDNFTRRMNEIALLIAKKFDFPGVNKQLIQHTLVNMIYERLDESQSKIFDFIRDFKSSRNSPALNSGGDNSHKTASFYSTREDLRSASIQELSGQASNPMWGVRQSAPATLQITAKEEPELRSETPPHGTTEPIDPVKFRSVSMYKK